VEIAEVAAQEEHLQDITRLLLIENRRLDYLDIDRLRSLHPLSVRNKPYFILARLPADTTFPSHFYYDSRCIYVQTILKLSLIG